MKLLICASEYYPYGDGLANVAFNVVEQCKKRGIICTVCSPTGPDIRLGNRWLIQKMGVLGLIYYWFQVSYFFKKNNYDAIWLHNPFLIRSNPFNHSLVTMHSTYYGESFHQAGSSFLLRLYRGLVVKIERNCLLQMKSSTIFSGVSPQVCNELEEIGIKNDRIILIPNGVDCKKFQPSENKKIIRKKFGIPDEDMVLLSVGRLTPAKQPHLMIDVFSFLERKMDKITFCIAGKGELLASTQTLAERKCQKIIFLGHLDNQSVLPELYACSDFFILTSQYEGGMPPLTLAEAMASGLPCIVSDIPNLKIVLDADCGIVVCFNEIQKAADEILHYLKSEHPDHAKNARNYALNNLDWSYISTRYYEIFRDLEIKHLNEKRFA